MPRAQFTVRRGRVRLDRTVADELGCGRRAARTLLREGRVLLDGRTASPSALVREGQRVVVLADAAQDQDASSAALPRASHAEEHPSGAVCDPSRPLDGPRFRVLWEGADVIALYKAAGVHTHGGRTRASVADELSRLRPALATVGPPGEAGIAHRLDRDTSGVLLVAKDAATYATLRAAFKSAAVAKTYLAIVTGKWHAHATIDRSLARRRTRVVPARRRDRPLAAVSSVAPLETSDGWSLVRVDMSTGVTHQVRAHLASCGHPILGDARYGGPPAPAGARAGQLLHALTVTLPDGRAFAAPPAADFVRALWRLRNRSCG